MHLSCVVPKIKQKVFEIFKAKRLTLHHFYLDFIFWRFLRLPVCHKFFIMSAFPSHEKQVITNCDLEYVFVQGHLRLFKVKIKEKEKAQ